MAGAYPFILLLLLLVSAAQLGLTAFLITCFDHNGWPGQRDSGPLIVKALYVAFFTVSLCGLRDLTCGLLAYSCLWSFLLGLYWAPYCSSHSVTSRTRSLLE